MDRLRRGHGGRAGLEKIHDLDEQRPVAVGCPDRSRSRGTERRAAVAGLPTPQSAKCTDSVSLPHAYHELAVVHRQPGHLAATGAHHGEQGLAAVDAVPEEIGVRGLEGAWRKRVAAHHSAERAVSHLLRRRGEPQR